MLVPACVTCTSLALSRRAFLSCRESKGTRSTSWSPVSTTCSSAAMGRHQSLCTRTYRGLTTTRRLVSWRCCMASRALPPWWRRAKAACGSSLGKPTPQPCTRSPSRACPGSCGRCGKSCELQYWLTAWRGSMDALLCACSAFKSNTCTCCCAVSTPLVSASRLVRCRSRGCSACT